MMDSKMCKGLSAVEILNLYRNMFYTEGSATERGIIANALNEVLPILSGTSEMGHDTAHRIFKSLRTCGHIDFDDNFCIKKLRFETLEQAYTSGTTGVTEDEDSDSNC